MCRDVGFPFFFFNDTATTEIYTLSLHDALPISQDAAAGAAGECVGGALGGHRPPRVHRPDAHQQRTSPGERSHRVRSEEHTSELQSQSNLVCRLLLEKKKDTRWNERTLSRYRPS